MMVNKKEPEDRSKITSVIAREGNGNIQITFNIPFYLIRKAKNETIREMAEDIEIPGFRKGKAPLDKVKEKIPENHVIEHALSHLLPEALAETIKVNGLKLVVYPKFELISADNEKPWEVRGISCELPEFSLGDYKSVVGGAIRIDSIIIPGEKNNNPSINPEDVRAKKEQTVIKALLDSVKIEVPEILVTEEADGRLANLLSRIEKLGLTLENYLASIGKTAQDIRGEYATQSRDAIKLDLILSKIAENEGIKPDPKDVSSALGVANASKDKNESNEESQKRLIESILARRAALDFLINLG